MRNPWVQIAQEVFEVSAPELAIELGISEAEAGWALTRLVPWALSRCPDHEPPSENDIVEGAKAAEKIARGVGYAGDAEEFARAVSKLRFPMLELLPEGIRVRGLDRYDASWGDKNRLLWDEWKAYRAGSGPRPGKTPAPEPRRSSAGVPPEKRRPDPDPDPDPDLNHHHQTSSSFEAGRSVVVVEPEKLLAALNAARTANGFDPEAQAPPGFSAWCKARGDEGFTVRDIAEGYARRFLNDASIRSKTRSIAVFITKCWKTRVLHIPEPAPPTPLTLELDKRLESLRLNGGAYAASQLREFEAVGLAGDLLQLQPRDSFHAKWASDHYATQLKELRLELLPAPGPPASS